MTKARDIADGTRYVDVTGDTMTGSLGVRGASTGRFGAGISLKGATPELHLKRDDGNGEGGVLLDNASGTKRLFVGTYNSAEETHIGTNGTQRIVVDTAGRVTTPYQPAASWKGALSTAATQKVPAATVVLNNGGYLDTSTNSGRFTCPVSGMYQVVFDAYTQYNGHYNWVTIRRNNSIITGTAIHWNKGGVGMHVTPSINTLIYCSANDYLEAFQDNLNGVAQDILENAFVSVALIG